MTRTPIKVAILFPGKTEWELREISGTLESFQALVGGYIEHVSVGDGGCYVNEDGIALNLPPTCLMPVNTMSGVRLVPLLGTVVAFCHDPNGEDELSITEAVLETLKAALTPYTDMDHKYTEELHGDGV